MVNRDIDLIKSYNGKIVQPIKQQKMLDEIKECKEEISSLYFKTSFMSMRGFREVEYEISIAAYVLFKACDGENPLEYSFEADKSIDKDVVEYIRQSKLNSTWNEMVLLTRKYEKDIFAGVVNFSEVENMFTTPKSIYTLSEKLLEVKDAESFADICCGSGNVVSMIKSKNPYIKAHGFDISCNDIARAKIENDVNAFNINYKSTDVFELQNFRSVFDKVFANYPMGMRLNDLSTGKEYLEKLLDRIPSLSKATSSDWLFNMLLVDLITDEGKAIGIMTNGSTWNSIDKEIRKYFVENGLIESVIALPGKMFSDTNIATSLIVLSHNNKNIRLVDASEMYVAGRRINEFDEENIEKILYALENESEYSILVDEKRLSENDYVLNISRYKNVSTYTDNGQTLESVIKRITRGVSIKAKELDECTSQEETENQYLMLANIHDGIIDSDLPYLKYIDKKKDKYCLTDRCLLLSKNGYPYKVAVAEVDNDKKILATGNVYIIEFDEEKIDPYYMAAFLNSEPGMNALKSITVGATVPNIGIEQLKKLIVPVPELNLQREIGQNYKVIRDEIVSLQFELDKAKSKMMSIYKED